MVHVDAQNVPILDLSISRPGWDDIRLREFIENTIRDYATPLFTAAGLDSNAVRVH